MSHVIISAHHQFHALWTACVGEPGYVKKPWRDLGAELSGATNEKEEKIVLKRARALKTAQAAPPQPKILVMMDEYLELMRELFTCIRASDFVPKQIVCLARGGLIPGNFASHAFHVPLAIMSVASYPDGATQ